VKTVFFDVDTQLDFLYPAGALYAPGAERIVNSLGKLTSFAAANHFPIISDVDAHTENDPEFKIWKPHCVAGTAGQQKACLTLLNDRLVLSSEPGALEAIRSRVKDTRQIILEKQNVDCFTNPNLRPLLDILAAERFVVYGVVTEVCVRHAAFGLLETGARVELVTDAIQSFNESEGRKTIEEFQGRGGLLTTVAAATACERGADS
jgi:nicotinamidase/pyrazinamidase